MGASSVVRGWTSRQLGQMAWGCFCAGLAGRLPGVRWVVSRVRCCPRVRCLLGCENCCHQQRSLTVPTFEGPPTAAARGHRPACLSTSLRRRLLAKQRPVFHVKHQFTMRGCGAAGKWTGVRWHAGESSAIDTTRVGRRLRCISCDVTDSLRVHRSGFAPDPSVSRRAWMS